MHWLLLVFAIICEVIATSFLKYSEGLSLAKIGSLIGIVVFFPLSTFVYAIALKKIDVSIAYAVWSGLGTVSMVLVGSRFFNEQVSLQKGLFMCLIIIGIAGLWLSK